MIDCRIITKNVKIAWVGSAVHISYLFRGSEMLAVGVSCLRRRERIWTTLETDIYSEGIERSMRTRRLGLIPARENASPGGIQSQKIFLVNELKAISVTSKRLCETERIECGSERSGCNTQNRNNGESYWNRNYLEECDDKRGGRCGCQSEKN